MKLSERITLLKAGYSKEDINNMIEEDKALEVAPAEDPKPVENNDYMKVLSVLANEVKDLKEAVYSSNISNSNVDGNKVIKAEDILGALINPNIEEDK